jgi:hemoglobin
MIVEYVRYRIEGESVAAFLAAYRSAAVSLDQSPQCRHYELARCVEEPERFVLRIVWTSLDGHLEGFRKSNEFRTFLAAVRPFIADIEEMQHYEATDIMARPTIYEAVGGAATMFELAKGFHEAMRESSVLRPLFARAAESHVPHLGMWLCEVFGGPKLYSQTLGDLAPLLARHARLDINEEQRREFVACAEQVLGSLLAPDLAAARDAILRYVEWGTHVAVENSKPDHVPNPAAGVPGWDWDSQC